MAVDEEQLTPSTPTKTALRIAAATVTVATRAMKAWMRPGVESQQTRTIRENPVGGARGEEGRSREWHRPSIAKNFRRIWEVDRGLCSGVVAFWR